MTRTEILARYRRLRQISKELHAAVLDIIATDVVLEWAKRLDLKTQSASVILGSENEMTLVEDLATYLPRLGRTPPLDRFARTARFAPGSDEALMLEAMRQSCFSLWRVERRHETAGLILRDLLREEDVWLVDEAMEQTAQPGMQFAARVVKLPDFAMTARILVPIIPELTEEIAVRTANLRNLHGQELAGDPRFVIAIYRAAVAIGIMDRVLLMNTRAGGRR
jgi:hypothetical protein